MGTSLARLNDAASIRSAQRDRLISFLTSADQNIERLSTLFDADIAALPEEGRVVAERIKVRAATLRANVADELARLNDSAWTTRFQDRVENVRIIMHSTDELAGDMAGFLATGKIPSEAAARRKLWILGGVVAAVAAGGYALWWREEKAAEAEQERMLASGEIEDCGCTG